MGERGKGVRSSREAVQDRVLKIVILNARGGINVGKDVERDQIVFRHGRTVERVRRFGGHCEC